MARSAPWCVMMAPGMKCLRCGEVGLLPSSAEITEFLAITAAFIERHSTCKPQQPDKPGRDPREGNPR